MALDGRLRATPADGRYLSLFFCVTRTKDETADSTQTAIDANMKIHYPTVSAGLDINFDLPVGKKRTYSMSFPAKVLPTPPLMYNPLPIKLHTRLFVVEDQGLAAVLKASGAAKGKAGVPAVPVGANGKAAVAAVPVVAKGKAAVVPAVPAVVPAKAAAAKAAAAKAAVPKVKAALAKSGS